MNSASFVFLAALALLALLVLLSRAWSGDRARFRAMEAHEQTGQPQPGWDRRFAWSPMPAPEAQTGGPAAPATVTAAVAGPRPPAWWQRSDPLQQPGPGNTVGPQSPAPIRAPGDSQVPATHDRVVVDGQPATVTGLERGSGATRVHLLRDDGQAGFVDIPDVDASVPVVPSGSPTDRAPVAPTENAPSAPAEPPRTPEAQPTTRAPAPPTPGQATRPATPTPTPTRPAPPAASMTLGGITVCLDEPAPARQHPAQHDLSPAEQRRRYLADQGYTGPTDSDGYPVFDVPAMATKAAG